MNGLQPHFYICFPLNQANYHPVIFNVLEYPRLARNIDFIIEVKTEMPAYRGGMEIVCLYNLRKKFLKQKVSPVEFNLEKLKELHLNAHNDERSIIDNKDPPRGDVVLMTERYFWHHPLVNLGSSRHALLLDYQLKGIGRNPLSIRGDYFHSWGGQYLWQALKAYVIGHLLRGIVPLDVLATNLVSTADREFKAPLGASAVSLSAREADALRIAQLATGFDDSMARTRSKIQKEILQRLKCTPEEHLERVIFNYAHMYLFGIHHQAITRENVTLEGKLIDYEDASLEISQEGMSTLVVLRNERLLFTSTLHLYLDAVELTALGLHYVFDLPLKRAQLRRRFKKMLDKLSREVFHVDPDFLSFSHKLLEIEAIYCQGESQEMMKSAPASLQSIRAYLKKSELIRTEDLSLYTHETLKLHFQRTRLRDQTLDAYNSRVFLDPEKIFQRVHRHLQLETVNGPMKPSDLLKFSGLVSELMAQHSMIFPFEWVDGKIRQVSNHRKTLESYWKKHCESFGSKLMKMDIQELDSHQGILRGLHLEIAGQVIYQHVRPQLVRLKIKK